MKQRMLSLVAALAVLVPLMVAAPSDARIERVSKEVRWRVANTTTILNENRLHPKVLGQDKMFKAGVICSSMVVDLSDAVPPPGYTIAMQSNEVGSVADTIGAFATLILESDSASSTVTACQLFVDYVPGGALGNQSGVAAVDPQGVQVYRKYYTSMGSRRAYAFHIPIYQTAAAFDTAAVAGDPSGTTATVPAPNLGQTRHWRFRFNSLGVGLGVMPAAKLRIEYWKDVR